MNKNTPIFSKFVDKTAIIGIASSGYLYSVYTFLPDHIYDPLVTVVPTTGAISSLFLPRLLKGLRKNSSKNKKSNTNESQAVVIEQTNDGNQVTVSEDIEETNIQEETVNEEYNSVQIDETIIQELIDKKLAATLEDINSTKQQLEDSLNTINGVKSEIGELKNSVNELKSAFETTLVDFKAFQTEIANPLNFMRKYFESIDIKNLSDPTLPLKINDDKISLDKQVHNTDSNIVETIEPKYEEHNNHNGHEEVKEIVENISAHGLDITSYINNDKVSLASIMELIYSLGEFIEKFGSHYHEVLSTQCKILGLNKEQEELLYSIADTLGKSKTSASTYIESLYKLATIMGIKDESVDTVYAKLKRKNVKKKKKKR